MTAQEIMEFWFGETFHSRGDIPAERLKFWFAGKPETDQLIRRRFADAPDRAAHGTYDEWLADPVGRLALILLCDQFPRNIHRGTPGAFAYDRKALEWALAGLEERAELQLPPIGRAFFFLPLEHAEDLALQDRSVVAFARLCECAPSGQKATFESFYDYALRHREVIARFGRFPHRNRVLERRSTAAEEAFLQLPGSSF